MVNWKTVELITLSAGGMQNGIFYEVSRKGKGVPLINVGDMYTGAPIKDENLELFDATLEEIKRFSVNDGDLFFTRSSVVPSGIAFCNWYKKDKDVPTLFDSHVVRFKTDRSKVVPMYLYLQCISPASRKYFISNAKTAIMTTIDQAILGKCPILLPPLEEQEKISRALSDMDYMIAFLEKLIAKKKAIKQGAMQELLTGIKRLPGFSGKWNNGKWKDVLSCFSSGATPYRGNADNFKGNIKWVSSGELNYNFIYETIEHISTDAQQKTNLTLHPAGTFLMAITGLEAAGTRGSCALLGTAATTNQSCMAIYGTSKMSTEYLFHYYVCYGNELAFQYCQGTKQQSYTAAIVKELPIFYPEDIKEQQAIASVLSDMDSEIEQLELKLAKCRQTKQGMMQKLLTGKIRLV